MQNNVLWCEKYIYPLNQVIILLIFNFFVSILKYFRFLQLSTIRLLFKLTGPEQSYGKNSFQFNWWFILQWFLCSNSVRYSPYILSYPETKPVLNTFEFACTAYKRYLMKYSTDGLKISLGRINRLRCYPNTSRTHKFNAQKKHSFNSKTLLYAAVVED